MGKSQRCPNSCVLAVLGVTAAAILAMVVYLGVTKLGDSTSSGNANAGHQVSLTSFDLDCHLFALSCRIMC